MATTAILSDDFGFTEEIIESIEIPLSKSVDFSFETKSGELAVVKKPDGSFEYFDLRVPKDSQPISFATKLNIAPLINVDGIEVSAELQVHDVTYTGGIPTGGSILFLIKMSGELLPRDFVWTLAASGEFQDNKAFNLKQFTVDPDGSLRFEVHHTGAAEELPFEFENTGYTISGDLLIGPGIKNPYRIRFDGFIDGELIINLGSSLAQFFAKTKLEIYFDTEEGLFELRVPSDETKAGIRFDLFQEFRGAVINNQWKSGRSDDSAENHLIKIERSLKDMYSDVVISWHNKQPVLSGLLVSHLLNEFEEILVNTKRQLQSLVGELPARISSSRVSFNQCPDQNFITTNLGDVAPKQDVQLELCLIAEIKESKKEKTVFRGRGTFKFKVGELNENGDISFSANSLTSNSESTLTVLDNHVTSFGDLVSLSIPKNIVFKFLASPGRNEFEYLPAPSKENKAAKIRLRIPATKKDDPSKRQLQEPESERFTFELDEFKVHSGGTDLRGRVLTEEVKLGPEKTSALKKPLGVKGVKPSSGKPDEYQIGEIAFKDSRLIYAQIQAAAEISYFDDGKGIFTLTVSETGENAWDIIADLEITGKKEFHVESLFTTFGISGFQFSTTYNTGDDAWKSDGSISGTIKFEPPQGKSASSLGPISDLFGKGVTVRFEDWNPLDLASENKFTIEVQPKKFEVAKILGVSLRGIEIETKAGTPVEAGNFKLLGDVTMKNLPGIDAELTFGGITIEPKLPFPEFSIDRIGAELTIPGSFTASGEFRHIKNDREEGFDGQFALKTEVLPPINGVVALTSLKTNKDGRRVPSVALYLNAESLEVPLFAGFYLRSLGFGLGMNRGLRGLMPDKDDQRTVQERLIAIVDDPRGLPSPSRLDSWEAAPPDTVQSAPKWMFVASGLITLGKLPDNKPHTVAGSALLSLNYEGEVFLGVNLWLFIAPQQTREREAEQHPVARGGILLSPNERILFGKFRTISKPFMNKEQAPELLQKVLSKVETTMMFQADPNGFLLEVGWPWETKIPFEIGPLHGELTSGFRFGIYRGIISFGLNWAIRMKLEAEKKVGFSVWIGRAEATFKVYGEGALRISFVGAVDHGLKPYLVGDARLMATVKLSVSAECRLSKKIGFVKIRLRISFKTSIELSISAALTMALDPKPALGVRGTARVSVSAGGYRLSGNVSFASNDGKIDDVRERINELLPPSLTPKPRKSDEASPPTPVAPVAAGAGQPSPVPSPPPLSSPIADAGGGVGEAAAASIDASPAMPSSIAATPPSALPTDDALLTPSSDAEMPAAADDPLSSTKQERWTYMFRRVEGTNLVRVLLFPAPGTAYPPPPSSDSLTNRFVLTLKDGAVFKRFHGIKKSQEPADQTLSWSENFDEKIIKQDELQRDNGVLEGEGLDSASKDKKDILLRDVLEALTGDKNKGFEHTTELVDERTWNPSPEHSDDPVAELRDDEYHSPFLRADTEYDRKVAEASGEQEFIEKKQDDGANEGMSAAMLLNELVELLRDDKSVDSSALSGYQLAPHLKLVLVFEDPSGSATDDPVKQLFPLQDGLKVNGNAVELRAIYDSDGEGDDKLPEYDVVTGPTAQSDDRICLNWELWREDINSNATADRSDRKIDFHYAELLEYRVERRIFGQDEEPLRKNIRPAFLDPGQESNQLVRPQYQYIDQDLDRINENDIVIYEIEAWSADRRLTRTSITVQRRTIKALPPLSQSQALLVMAPNSEAVKLEFTVITKEDREEANDEKKKEEPIAAENLRLRYRIVPASTQGIYGKTHRQAGSSKWSKGIQGRSEDEAAFAIPFAEPIQRQSVPWKELAVIDDDNKPDEKILHWEEVRTPDGKAVEGFRCIVEQQKLLDKIQLRIGDALEFFIGVERQKNGESLQRSPMVRCRHAVSSKQGDLSIEVLEGKSKELGLLQLEMTRGSNVDAIEFIPAERRQEFINPRSIAATVDYGDVIVEPSQKPEVPTTQQEINDVTLQLEWPHDDSLTARWMQNDDKTLSQEAFDPVVGYRIYRTDMLDPSNYPLPVPKNGEKEKLQLDPALTINVVSETEYRARPSSVVVTGITGGETKQQSITTDWNIVQEEDLEGETKGLQNWLEFLKHGEMPLDSYLAADLISTIKDVAEQIGATFLCRSSFPVLPNVYRPFTDNDSLMSRFESFKKNFDWKNDPLGWHAAEALGMSCECIFLDSAGRPIHAEIIRNFVRGKGLPYRVTPVFFQADDGKTLLDVIRFSLNRYAINDDSTEKFDIRTSLLFQLSALPPEVTKELTKIMPQLTPLELQLSNLQSKENMTEDEKKLADKITSDIEILREPLDKKIERAETQLASEIDSQLRPFLKRINDRQKRSKVVHDGGQKVLFYAEGRDQISEAQQRSNRGRAVLTLPIQQNRPISCRLPVPDRWAREYRIAIEVIRRYDAVRDLAGGSQDQLVQEQHAEIDNIREVIVNRSKSLGDLNLFATPLPGAIQAGIFRHVASFAATSNAEQKDRGQFGPTSIYIERQIANRDNILAILKKIPKRINPTNPDAVQVWAAYQQWLKKKKHFETDSKLSLLVVEGSSEEKKQQLHLEIPPVAQHGLYGADRYVVPDVPPGYEYRFCVQAKAGIVRSRVCRTGFVEPMFDSIDDPDTTEPRMQPKAYEKPFAAIDFIEGGKGNSRLTLTIPLVYQRFHLRKELRPLWVDAEEKIPDASNIGFGSLPDLYLKYQVMLLENYTALKEDPKATKVLIPLFEVIPPELQKVDGNSWFSMQNNPASIVPVHDEGDIVRLTQKDGALCLKTTLSLQEPQAKGFSSVLKLANAKNELEKVIYLTVSRAGKVSDLAVNKPINDTEDGQ